MKTISKKSLFIICAVCLVASLSLVMAASTLTANFGTITVNNTPAAVVITSATWGSTTGTVAGDKQSVTFSSIPAMTVEATTTVNIVVHNNGLTSAAISAAVSGQGSVLTFTPIGSLPTSVAGHADATFTYTVTAVAAGSVTPSITITWS